VRGARQVYRLGRRREQARAHQPFGMGGPKAWVQPGQRVQGVEQLLGKDGVRQGAGRHTVLLGKRAVTRAASDSVKAYATCFSGLGIIRTLQVHDWFIGSLKDRSCIALPGGVFEHPVRHLPAPWFLPFVPPLVRICWSSFPFFRTHSIL
jgi:hypothetical protein